MYYTPGPDDIRLEGMQPDPKPKGAPAERE
jgi:hypothetical protein